MADGFLRGVRRLTDHEWVNVVVTMNDGSRVRGVFGVHSHASSDRPERDIYIQETFVVDEYGRWKRLDNPPGIWVSSSAIKHIEFFWVKENEEPESQLSLFNGAKLSIIGDTDSEGWMKSCLSKIGSCLSRNREEVDDE